MAAKILCDVSEKEKIIEMLKNEFENFIEMIEVYDEPDVCFVDEADGFRVIYPIGEIYGSAWDYVEVVMNTFEKCKKMFSKIAIQGIVYCYDDISGTDSGYYFICDKNEDVLRKTQKWQQCAVCEGIYEKDVCYNSAKWDCGEGTCKCLCSPLCMIEYSLMKGDDKGVLPNSLLDDNEIEIFEEKGMIECIWDRIQKNFDLYCADIRKNKDELEKIITKKGINRKKREKLLEMCEVKNNI